MPIKEITLSLFLTLFFTSLNAQVLGSLEFDGGDNYVKFPTSPMNDIGFGEFTFEVWIKGEESAQNDHPMIFSNREGNSSNGMLLFFHNQWGGSASKMLCVQMGGDNFFLLDNGTYNGSLLDNKCHHLAVTRSGTKLSFYADGALLGTKVVDVFATLGSTGPLLIGKDEITNNTFRGLISQCRIWNVVRSEEQISANMDNGLMGTETGLLASWDLSEGNGQIATDQTGNHEGILGSTTADDSKDPDWSTDGCVTATVTTNQNLKTISIDISPNPTQNFLQLNYTGLESLSVKFFDQVGRVYYSEELSAGPQSIDLRSVAAGLYFLEIRQGEKVMTEKVVKL